MKEPYLFLNGLNMLNQQTSQQFLQKICQFRRIPSLKHHRLDQRLIFLLMKKILTILITLLMS